MSGAAVRRTIPVQYLPNDPWVNRPVDPDRDVGTISGFSMVVSGVSAALGWAMCAAGVVRWRRGRRVASPVLGGRQI